MLVDLRWLRIVGVSCNGRWRFKSGFPEGKFLSNAELDEMDGVLHGFARNFKGPGGLIVPFVYDQVQRLVKSKQDSCKTSDLSFGFRQNTFPVFVTSMLASFSFIKLVMKWYEFFMCVVWSTCSGRWMSRGLDLWPEIDLLGQEFLLAAEWYRRSRRPVRVGIWKVDDHRIHRNHCYVGD